MSDYHVRTTDLMLKTVHTVFHIPIPAANNLVGVSWRAALVDSLGGADNIESVLPSISSTELAAMKDGSIYEKSAIVRFSSTNLTNAERLAEIEAAYTAAETSVTSDFSVSLNFYGKSGDV